MTRAPKEETPALALWRALHICTDETCVSCREQIATIDASLARLREEIERCRIEESRALEERDHYRAECAKLRALLADALGWIPEDNPSIGCDEAFELAQRIRSALGQTPDAKEKEGG